MEEDGRWVTLKSGKKVFIKEGQSLIDALVRQKVIKKSNAEKLSDLEYETMSEEFAETLTEKEKELIETYGIGMGASYNLNSPKMREFEKIYRVSDIDSSNYTDKKLSYMEALNTDFDKMLYKIKTGNENYDENLQFNYEMIMRDKNFVNGMDKIFDNKGIKLDKDIIVYRKGHENLQDLQSGVIRYGYTSTSAKSRINKKTPGGLMLGENEFEIIVPKGMKVLPIKQLVPEQVKQQNEILLPRNIKFELVEDKSLQGGWNQEKWKYEKPRNKYLVKVLNN